jgi:hypothetical protein
MHTKNLTKHQKRILGIVEDGGAAGVAMDSIIREERAEGRFRSNVFDTVYSLMHRGLVRIETTRTPTMGDYGVYLKEHRQVYLVEQEN